MRLASYIANDGPSFGLVRDDGIVDLKRRLPFATLRTLVAAGVEAAAIFASERPDFGLADIQWLPPITDPVHLLGIGLNTRSHFIETTALMNRVPGDYPTKPRIFVRSPLSVVGSGAEIIVPKVSDKLDYEGEIVIVIGREARYVTVEQARDVILGYACGNDGSVRDYQTHSNQVTAGKNFFRSGSWGPWIVTHDEVGDPANLTLNVEVNGERRQRLEMQDLIFSFEQLISYISEFIPLQPGDAIFTGSPEGVGAITKKWIRAGDSIEIASAQLGTLRNLYAQESK